MKIVDAHVHLGPMFDVRPGMFPGSHATEIIDLMDTADIEASCVFAPLWQGPIIQDETFEDANAALARETKDRLDRFFPYARVDPNHGEKALAEMRRCKDEYGFVGLKLHPTTEFFMPNNMELMAPVMELCAQWKWPIFFHSGYYPTCQPALFIPLADAFPTVPLVLGHIGYAHYADCIVAARQCESIYLETSANSTSAVIAEVLERTGPTKLLFGTDIPFTDPVDVLEKIKAVPGLGGSDLELVLGQNMLRLLGHESWSN